MDRPPLRYHCKDCGLTFDSGKSLDVHLQYHKENLLSKWGSSSAGEESNNNHVAVKPSKSPRVAAAPADSSDSAAERFSPGAYNFAVNRSTPPVAFHYPPPSDMRPPSEGGGSRPGSNFTADAEPDYILGSGSGFPHRRSPAPGSGSPAPHLMQTSSALRFHPYQLQQPVYGHPDQRNGGVSSSSPAMIAGHRCEKCGYACEGPTALLEHIQNAHQPPPPQNFNFNADFLREHGQEAVKDEPQAEILDLDSHKVHVYQPPGDENGESSQLDMPGMVPWLGALPPDKKLYTIHPVHGQMNGSGMPSPDFNVSTTTLGSPDLPHHHQPYQTPYDHHMNQLPSHITSTQLPVMASKPNAAQMQSKGSGNASWKSNEARRPKTYNCTACNKWFTSSGHLKRHYNTTLHKNAVKQSGVPDPAHHPVGSHHHPPKDPAPPYAPRQQDSPPTPPALAAAVDDNAHMMAVKLEEGNGFERQQHAVVADNGHNFLANPPNSLAGPSEVTGGLLLHSTQFQTGQEETRGEPTPPFTQHHQTFLPFPGAAHPTYPQGMTVYPNSQPPHVSSIPIVTSSITGNSNALEQTVEFQQIWGPNGELRSQLIALAAPADVHRQPQILPSFAQFAHSFAPFPQTVQLCERRPEESASDANVGGLSPARVSSADSFYPAPGEGFEIADVRSLDGPLSPACGGGGDDTCDGDALPATEASDFIDTPYPSPDAGGAAAADDEERSPFDDDDRKAFEPELKVFVEEHKVFVEEQACSVSSTVERSPTPPIRCDDCDKVFNRACYLTQHNKSFHNGARPYKCEKCGKRFEAESQHSAHLAKHAGDKPFKCEICPKQFNHKTDLRRHMCLHSGDKPYACNVCGKGFIRKDHMVKHCDTHRRKHAVPPGVDTDRLYTAKACESPSLPQPPPPPPPTPLHQLSH